MAPRFPRRRRDADERPQPPNDPDNVDLAADEHAWWAQRDLTTAWSTAAADGQEEGSVVPPRDVLAVHLGEDWRTQFGLDPSGPQTQPGAEADTGVDEPAEGPADEPADGPGDDEIDDDIDDQVDPSDPYAVLGVEPTAPWEDIVVAHRAQARRHHPDRMVGRSEAAIERAEQRIRDINVAYQELRIRRGR